MRGLLGVGSMGIMAIGTCAGMYAWLFGVGYDKLKSPPGRSWSDSGAPAFFALYILYGWVYSGYQLAVGWCSSSLSNDPIKLAQFAGYMRACSSMGMTISFALASESVSLLTQLNIEFALYVVGFVGMIYVVLFKIKETNYLDEDGVIAPQQSGNKQKENNLD
ncbi:hypothetical protein Golomagni_05552 [Golovinomyces magnicellulatus]|nr:hypothetical protein Golomagni_05552 [Golovinomyces magnicellulatus]